MEPELEQALKNLLSQLEAIKDDIKEIKNQTKSDHDTLIEMKTRQGEIIRDVDAIGRKQREQAGQIWKIYLWAAGVAAASGGGITALIGG